MYRCALNAVITSNARRVGTCISVPAEHAAAVQRLLWWLWLTRINWINVTQNAQGGAAALNQTFGFESIGNLNDTLVKCCTHIWQVCRPRIYWCLIKNGV